MDRLHELEEHLRELQTARKLLPQCKAKEAFRFFEKLHKVNNLHDSEDWQIDQLLETNQKLETMWNNFEVKLKKAIEETQKTINNLKN